jgi:hypothetical protein
MLASVLLDWVTPLAWLIVDPLALPLLTTFTPFPTRLSDELTMLIPDAPLKEPPERFTVPLLFSVIVELFAAIASCSSPAAVTLSIWLSRSGCCLLCLWCAGLDVLWP